MPMRLARHGGTMMLMSLFHRPLPRTLPAALRDIEDKRIAVRRSAVTDLARHKETKSPEVLAALQKALRDTDPAVRTEAAYALGDARAADALPALMVAMDDSQMAVRQVAIDALGQIGDSRATARLLRGTEDDRPDVRFQALISLVRVSRDDGADALLRGARDEDTHVRYIAVRMVEELFAATDGADGSLDVVLDDRFRDAARTWLKDDDPGVRAAAAVLLARAGDKTGAAVLVDVLEDRITVDPEEEAAAVMMAGPLGLTDATEALERRAFGLRKFVRERYAWHAMVSLARLGHPRARSTIVRDLTSWKRDRRTLAVVAAGRARMSETQTIIERMKGDDAQADASAVEEALAQLHASGSS